MNLLILQRYKPYKKYDAKIKTRKEQKNTSETQTLSSNTDG
jgi:hypothetical protein